MKFIMVLLDIAKFDDFRLKNADVTRTHVTYIFFGCFLGKV